MSLLWNKIHTVRLLASAGVIWPACFLDYWSGGLMCFHSSALAGWCNLRLILCVLYTVGWDWMARQKSSTAGFTVNARRIIKDLWMALDYCIIGSCWHAERRKSVVVKNINKESRKCTSWACMKEFLSVCVAFLCRRLLWESWCSLLIVSLFFGWCKQWR